jgi:hypothetical protein
VDSISATNVANLNKIDAAIFWKLIKQSRANGPVLIQFIESSSTDKKQDALKLLQAISEKDLRDMTAETLLNHLKYSIDKKLLAEIPEDIYYQYILNPRIGDREFIWPWRNVLIGALGENLNAEAYFNWVKDNIQIDDTANYSRAFINPASSFRYGIADEYSRDILLLALWRSNGIPARYETGTGFLQYYKSGEWHTLSFEQKDKTHEIVYANLQFTNKNKSQKLEYYKHFTIAKLEGGKFETVEYEWDKDLEKFPKENKLSPGYYRLCTGNRMPDGSVAVHFSFFELKANELTNVEVGLSVVNQDISKLGMLDNIKWLRSGETKNACTVPNKSIKLLLWFKANNEPSKHALESISKLSKTLVNNNVILLLISENHYKKEELDPQYFGNLPEKTELYIDEKLALLQQAAESMHSQWGSEYPYVLLINDNNEIVYKSEGYKIGIEADLKLIIDKLNDK